MRYYSFLDPTLFNNTDSKKAGQLLIQDKFYGFTKQLITLAEEQAEARKLLDESKLKIRFIFEEKNFSNEIIFGTNVLSSDKKNEILNKLYLLVIDSYTLYLNELNSEFYKTFKDEIFGLDFQDQRKIALKYYKEIYKNICVEETNFVDNIKAKEINDNTNLSKLDVIFKQKIIYKDNLIPIAKLIFNLLDEKKFIKNFKLKFTIIDEILNYEIWKQIMVELNNKYKFEQDFYFTNTKVDTRKGEDILPSEKDVKFGNSKINITPFSDFIRHENKIEIERIIKAQYSDLRGVSLRYLIEFLKEEGVLLLNHGHATKLYNSIKTLFEEENIGAYTSIFDKKVFSSNDIKYKNTKISFKKVFKDIL